MAETVVDTTNPLLNKVVCMCPWHERKDLGPVGNEGMNNVHLFKCQHHKTIEKFNIKTGERIV